MTILTHHWTLLTPHHARHPRARRHRHSRTDGFVSSGPRVADEPLASNRHCHNLELSSQFLFNVVWATV